MKYAKSHVLLLFRPIFGEKLKTAPPKEIECRSRQVDVVIRCEKVFEFPILAEKSDSISVKTFFFLETTCFWAEKSFEFPILAKNSDSILVKTFFFYFYFWRPPVSGLKNRLNFRFWPKNQTQFWRRPFFFVFFFFFFWRPPVFERKKPLNFRAFREIPSQFSGKPCETDSRTMKIRLKVVCTFLTLSKKPPLFQILATRLL